MVSPWMILCGKRSWGCSGTRKNIRKRKLFLFSVFSIGCQLFKHIHKHGYNLRVELRAGAAFHFFDCFNSIKRLPIGPVIGDRVVGISDGNDSGFERDALSLELSGVALSVISFMMRKNDVRDVPILLRFIENTRALYRMKLHDFPLGRIQLACFIQNGFVYADFPDIMQKSGNTDSVDFFI